MAYPQQQEQQLPPPQQQQQFVAPGAPPPAPPKHLEVGPFQSYNNNNGNNMSKDDQQAFQYSASNNSAPSLSMHRQSSPLPSIETSKTPPGTRTSSVINLSMTSEQLLNHSHLKPGNKASLLSYAQTINMYRENAKKTNSPDIQCDFAIFMVEAAKPIQEDDPTRVEYLAEAEKLLKQLAARGHAESQYYLGNLYASGVLSKKGKNEFDKAFPLFVQATKHHHPDAAYR
jgi:TPR repeat protein